MRGTAKRTTIDSVHIQKAPFTLAGLKIRKRSNPAEKENNNRRNPPVNSVPVSEYPTHKSPNGPIIANDAKPHPATKTNNERTFVENLRMNSTFEANIRNKQPQINKFV